MGKRVACSTSSMRLIKSSKTAILRVLTAKPMTWMKRSTLELTGGQRRVKANRCATF